MPSPLDRLVAELEAPQAFDRAGREMHALARRLYPIPRSITGDGVRETLAILGERLPLTIHEVPSGTPVLDWTVPPEWNVREAWIKGPDGEIVVDFRDHSLHLVSYSAPVHRTMPLAELRAHLHTLPEQPDLIPYRTSYYQETWGFCLAHRVLEALPDGDYEVLIDSTLDPEGSLTYGELLIPGAGGGDAGEILVSCHVCHPSLANDNLSGIAVTAALAERLLAANDERGGQEHNLAKVGVAGSNLVSRFVWLPGTIGAIAWLARNPDAAERVAHGLVAANLGDPGAFHYKRSRRGDAPIDRAAAHVLAHLPAVEGAAHAVEEFVPFGYDERQYGSPGFDLPVGSLTRTPWGRYPEYHTSADDLDLIRSESLAGSLAAYLRIFAVLAGDRTYRNLSPKGEPQLGRRGLYDSLGGAAAGKERQLALLWVLNQSDGESSLLAIAERSGMPFDRIRDAADALVAVGLLGETASGVSPR